MKDSIPAGTFHGIKHVVKSEGVCPISMKWKKDISGPLVECQITNTTSRSIVLMPVDKRYNWDNVNIGSLLFISGNGKVRPYCEKPFLFKQEYPSRVKGALSS